MPRLSRVAAALWFCFAGLLLAPGGAAAVPSASPPSIDDKVTVRLTTPLLNRATATFDVYATIVNTSQSTFDGPMQLVVTGATPANVTLANTSGTTLDGFRFVSVPIDSRGFMPGRALTVLLKFANPSLARFTINRSVRAIIRGAPAVVAIGPNPATIALGGSQPLTLQIQNPSATQAMRVTISSASPTIVSVPATVTVPAGRATMTVTAVGRLLGGPIVVTATLGTSSASTNLTVTSRPPAPIVAGPLNVDATLVTGSGISGASINVLVNGQSAGTGVVNGSGQFSVSVAPLQPGDVVRAIQSVAGLVSPASTSVAVPALPPTPIVDAPFVLFSAVIRGTAEPHATVNVFRNNGPPVLDVNLGSNVVADATGHFTLLTQENDIFSLTATQTVGGVQSLPSAPIITAGSPPPPTVTLPLVAGDQQVTGTGTPEAHVSLVISKAGGGASSARADVGGDGRWSTGVRLDAGDTIVAHQSFVFFNGIRSSAETAQIPVLPIPPAPTVIAPVVAGQAEVTGTAAVGASVEVFVDGASRGTAIADDFGVWVLTTSVPGGQTVQARQTAGGIVSAFSDPIAVASAPPPPRLDNALVGGSTVVSGSGSVGALVTVVVDGTNKGLTTVASDGTWRLGLPGPLAVGDVVRASQLVAGVTSALSNAVTAATTPASPTVSPAIAAGDVQVFGTAIPNATVRVTRDGGGLGTTAATRNGDWALTSPDHVLSAGEVFTATQFVAGVESAPSAAVTVGPPVLRHIDIVGPTTTVSVAKGFTRTFTAQGTFSDGSVQSPLTGVTWSSDANGVATITSAGVATGVGQGTAHVRASRDGLQSAATTLVVTPPAVVSLAVTPQGPSIIVGTTLQLHANTTLTDGSTPDVTGTVAWSSDHENFVTVSPSGLVTGAGVGSATITATLTGGFTATTLVTVNPVPITGPPPTIARASPSSGTSLGGTLVTIFGANFTAQMTATIGGVAATQVSVVNSTTMTVRAPAGAVGVVADIAISNTNGSASLPGAYAYLFPFTIPGAVAVATGTSGALTVSLIEPAFTTTSVSVANQNASVATLPGSVPIAPGFSTVDVPITPASAGVSTVTVTIAGANLQAAIYVTAAFSAAICGASSSCAIDLVALPVGVLGPPDQGAILSAPIGVEVIAAPLATLTLTGTVTQTVTLALDAAPTSTCAATSENASVATAQNCVVAGDGSVSFTVTAVGTGEAIVDVVAGTHTQQLDVLVNQGIATPFDVLAAPVGVTVFAISDQQALAALPVGVEVVSEPLATLALSGPVIRTVTFALGAAPTSTCTVTSGSPAVATAQNCVVAADGSVSFTVTSVATGEAIVIVTAGTQVQQLDVLVNQSLAGQIDVLARPIGVKVCLGAPACP